MQYFDVLVIGGGHAGVEAALVAARMGCNTLLITQQIESIGQMSCNPSIGGIGKGHLVKEIDALGGLMGHAADAASIQSHTLNRSKGPAVWATRAQIDRLLYKAYVRAHVEGQEHLSIFQHTVDSLCVEQDRVTGIITHSGLRISARTVILTTGTFLSGLIHIGLKQFPGGRAGDAPSTTLAKQLNTLFHARRFKTGTPPRLDGRTISYKHLKIQLGDDPPPHFSYRIQKRPNQVPCHIAHTNLDTHALIREAAESSPVYRGIIQGVEPRYCPSIESKVLRFPDRSTHQIFLEPEGLTTYEVYPNGISTSLPFESQEDMVHSIKGLEHCRIIRPGYAIEYDCFDPKNLRLSLETQSISGLFFAGQINGTTGYEEAAAQGLIAGINAARQVLGKEVWIPTREQSYLGVLVDDLVTQGTNEPYRMFTSRAEYRLSLREDNADLRLTQLGYDLGCVHEAQWRLYCEKQERIEQERDRLRHCWIRPNTPSAERFFERFGGSITTATCILDLLKRPHVDWHGLMACCDTPHNPNDYEMGLYLTHEVRYSGYLKQQDQAIHQQRKQEHLCIPDSFDYDSISSMSNEIRQKLKAIRPATLSQAARISGMTPAALSVLLIFLKKASASKNI